MDATNNPWTNGETIYIFECSTCKEPLPYIGAAHHPCDNCVPPWISLWYRGLYEAVNEGLTVRLVRFNLEIKPER